MGRHPLKIIFTLALLFSLGSPLPAADKKPELLVTLAKSQIYAGDSVQYTVMLTQPKEQVKPDMSAFRRDFKVKLVSTQSRKFISGMQANTVLQYVYVLTPLSTGEVTVPAPTVTFSNGEKLVGRSLLLNVRPPEEQDLVKLFITASPQSVYPTQKFEVTLAVAIKALPGELANRNPLSLLRGPLPHFEVPWVQHLPEGLQPVTDANRWLTDLQSTSGTGFSINNVMAHSRSIFDFGMNQRLAAFGLTPKQVTLPDATGQDTTYWFYEFPRRFVADRPGQFTFGPVSLKGSFLAGVSEIGEPMYENLFVSAQPATVVVNDVPTDDQPADYCGAVGKFTGWTATFNPTQTRVDSPVTLTLTLNGTGSTADVKPPDLETVPAVAESFKTYEGTRQDEGNAVKFVYTLRPENEAIKEFPAVPVSYFDVETGRYETLSSRPIPIEVGPAEKLATSQIIGAGGLLNQHQALQVSSEGVFANVTDPDEFCDQTPRPELWFGVLAGLAVAYVIVVLGTKRHRRLHEDVHRARRRGALGQARARIAEGRRLLRAGETTRGAEAIHAALAGLVAAAAGLPASGMTTVDACRKLEAFGADAQLVEDLRELFKTCDAARYGGSDATLHGLIDRLDSLMNRTATTLKKQLR